MKKTTKKTKRRGGDVNVTAFDIVNELTAERPAMEAGITDHIWTLDELIGAL